MASARPATAASKARSASSAAATSTPSTCCSRAGLKVFVYCGKTRLDFQTRDDEIDDGLIRKPVKRVVCKMGGTSTRTIDLGWVLDFGAIDWTDLGMALREFVSNAIDRTVREENGEFIPAPGRRPAAGRLVSATRSSRPRTATPASTSS